MNEDFEPLRELAHRFAYDAQDLPYPDKIAHQLIAELGSIALQRTDFLPSSSAFELIDQYLNRLTRLFFTDQPDLCTNTILRWLEYLFEHSYLNRPEPFYQKEQQHLAQSVSTHLANETYATLTLSRRFLDQGFSPYDLENLELIISKLEPLGYDAGYISEFLDGSPPGVLWQKIALHHHSYFFPESPLLYPRFS